MFGVGEFCFSLTLRDDFSNFTETKLVLCLKQKTFLLTALIVKCVVTDLEAKEPLLVVPLKICITSSKPQFFSLFLDIDTALWLYCTHCAQCQRAEIF